MCCCAALHTITILYILADYLAFGACVGALLFKVSGVWWPINSSCARCRAALYIVVADRCSVRCSGPLEDFLSFGGYDIVLTLGWM